MEAERRRIAEVLEAYDVGQEIGRGASGVVYTGRHRHLARDVAIKQLPTAFGADPSLRARFTSEARLVASLDHPHIVPVYDYVERDGLYLIVMEHLHGGTLWERFSSRGVALDEAVAVILATCAALDYAHGRGIFHRDVKPDNVLLAADGTPKLADFGIAKLLSSTRTALTVAGTAMGTPAYMAPEQAQAGGISPATDVYACAVMLYELLAGSLPFPESSDPVTQLYQHVHQQPRPLGEIAPAVPVGLCDATMRALAKAPADRHQSAEDFGVALATAAAAAWGPDWLGRSGFTVMDRGRISAAARQPTHAPRGPRAAATVMVRGTGIDHPVLGPATQSTEPAEPAAPAEPAEEVAGLAAPAGLGRAPLEAPDPPPVGATGGPPPSAPSPPPRQPASAPQPAVLAPLPPRRPDGTGRGRRILVAASLAVGVVALVALAVAMVRSDDVGGGGAVDPGDETRATTATTPETTTPGTTASIPPSRPPGRFVEIDDISVEGDRYHVLYTAYEFVPRIDDDPAQYHVHFFWNTYQPEQAGRNAADYGATVGRWELWDQPVFDAFTLADRPPEATQICAVVGTYEHNVDNPANHHCVDLPA